MLTTPTDVRMTEFTLYLSSRDSMHLYQQNTPSECQIQLPKSYQLEGSWTCALIDLSLECDFSPRSKRLYLCCDLVEESYVRDTLAPVLRNIEVNSRYKKLKTELFTLPLYVPIKTRHLHSLKLEILDENLKPVVFKTNDLHCVIHFKQTWVP